MTDEELKNEIVYLKRRNAELQGDVAALQAEVTRLTQQLERIFRRARDGGQS
jgi:hypothetical protein